MVAGFASPAPRAQNADPRGTWLIILQGASISYSTLELEGVNSSLSGRWRYDRKTTYFVSGALDADQLRLRIQPSNATGAPVLGTISAEMDGDTDMVGIVELGRAQTPFQGAQHSRLLIPLPEPVPPTPFGEIP